VNLRLFEDVVEEIAARLDLREPNREAVQTLAAEISQYYDVDERQSPFEAVIDSATGVGKTYVLVGAMELLATCYDVRDFVVVTPGRTILEKTVANFTPGHSKSVVDAMSLRPVVITSDNFATPAIRAAMDDPTRVKVYVFTVQSLIKPESKAGRKTHKFQEGLGTEFYAWLKDAERLVVFADEHHCYYGPSFSKAVRDLDPWVLVGLTATPDKKTPDDQIIFRYPLAAAVADKLVKTPVIVGRRDDRTDPTTKLHDGLVLLRAKQKALQSYASAHRISPVNPIMLVVAKTTDEADEYGAILRSEEFFGGQFEDAVLVVHSKAPDEALAELEKVEDPLSQVRVIISVGMLKEGWDVKNVYVIASMRASVSEILTEQTLGRGMRLPFGSYTGIEILDTLEVVAHERYEDLLKKAGVLNEAFIDFRTRAALRVNAQGQQVVVIETTEATATPLLPSNSGVAPLLPMDELPTPSVTSVEERTVQAEQAAVRMKRQIARRTDVDAPQIPLLRMTPVSSPFSLRDITDLEPFRRLGAALASDPDGELNRTLVSARIVAGPGGIRHTELVRARAADRIQSIPTLFSLAELRQQLEDMVLASPVVPARKENRAALKPIMDAFFDGLGPKAESTLSASLDRAGARLVRLVGEEQKKYLTKPHFEDVIELNEFTPARTTDKDTTVDRFGPFSRSLAYEGWDKSLFPVEWFDSEPERRVANMVDNAEDAQVWARLHIGELPILWTGAGREYNPDFIVIDQDGTRWVVEVKMDKEMSSAEVQGKREAAKRWANYVSASSDVGAQWRYLLASETDVRESKDSWLALKRLGL
jgi:type III restriction enzyme